MSKSYNIGNIMHGNAIVAMTDDMKTFAVWDKYEVYVYTHIGNKKFTMTELTQDNVNTFDTALEVGKKLIDEFMNSL